MLNIICCSMIQKEVEFILKEIDLKSEVAFFDGGYHIFERLERDLTGLIKKTKEKNNKPIIVIVGEACHLDMTCILDQHSVVGLNTANCFEALLGSDKERLDKESNNWYITSLWFERWEEIFKVIGWTEVDARLKIGYANRIILLDTGLVEITDEKILKLFDFIQVPIEVKKVDLEHLKNLILEAVDRAKNTGSTPQIEEPEC